MAIRFYLLPGDETVARGNSAQGPKYLSWLHDPDPPALINAAWNGCNYGYMPVWLVCADVTALQHTTLAAMTDVIAAPSNLDNPVGANLNTVQNALEQLRIPSDWITGDTTHRQVLRLIAGVFQFSQRYYGRHIKRMLGSGILLDTQFRNLPQAMRDELIDVADDTGYDRSSVSNTTSLRVILRLLGQQWAGTPLHFGLTVL